MNIVFDHVKESGNIQKHGVSLADAALIEWDSAVTWPDVRHDYQEPRMVGLGYIKDRLFSWCLSITLISAVLSYLINNQLI